MQETQSLIEAKLRKQQEESKMDSQWLQQEEMNLKKRLSLVTNNSNIDGGEVSGPLSGSYHGAQSSGPGSLNEHFAMMGISGNDMRPLTPVSNSGTLSKSITRSMERSTTPSTSGQDDKTGQKVRTPFRTIKRTQKIINKFFEVFSSLKIFIY